MININLNKKSMVFWTASAALGKKLIFSKVIKIFKTKDYVLKYTKHYENKSLK